MLQSVKVGVLGLVERCLPGEAPCRMGSEPFTLDHCRNLRPVRVVERGSPGDMPDWEPLERAIRRSFRMERADSSGLWCWRFFCLAALLSQ
jgi:hypothetical protein